MQLAYATLALDVGRLLHLDCVVLSGVFLDSGGSRLLIRLAMIEARCTLEAEIT